MEFYSHVDELIFIMFKFCSWPHFVQTFKVTYKLEQVSLPILKLYLIFHEITKIKL